MVLASISWLLTAAMAVLAVLLVTGAAAMGVLLMVALALGAALLAETDCSPKQTTEEPEELAQA